MDAYARDRSRLETKMLGHCDLDLVYYKCPTRHLRAGCLSITRLAVEAHRGAAVSRQPTLLVHAGDRTRMNSKFPRETEVATLVAWPDGRVWCAKGIVGSRRVTEQMAFECSTGLDLPVADQRVSTARRQQAVAVAIAVVAATCGLPLPPDPGIVDGKGRTARVLAREKGLDRFLDSWK